MGTLWSCRGSETAIVAILLHKPVLHWQKYRVKIGIPKALVNGMESYTISLGAI